MANWRLIINGPPNSRKTTSVVQTAERPLHILSFPREKGYEVIPDEEGIVKHIMSIPYAPTRPTDWAAIYTGVVKKTAEIFAGKHGKVVTFCGDGCHKFYEVILAMVTNGASAVGDNFEAKLYTKSHALFGEYLDMVSNAPIENVVLTAWDGLEKDNPEDKGKDATSHVYPDLPGKQAKRVMGEFSVVYAGRKDPPEQVFYWQTQPLGRIWGAGLKVTPAIATQIPLRVRQNVQELKAMTRGKDPKEYGYSVTK